MRFCLGLPQAPTVLSQSAAWARPRWPAGLASNIDAHTLRFCALSQMRQVGGGDAAEWYTAHRPPVGGVGEGDGLGEGEVVGVGVPLGVGSPDGWPAQT